MDGMTDTNGISKKYLASPKKTKERTTVSAAQHRTDDSTSSNIDASRQPQEPAQTGSHSQNAAVTYSERPSNYNIDEAGGSLHTWTSTEIQHSWADGRQEEVRTTEEEAYQLQQWAYETSDASMTFAEKLEKSKWV